MAPGRVDGDRVPTRGTVTFTSVFPACYPGRWPHVHFEVYDGLTSAPCLPGDAEEL